MVCKLEGAEKAAGAVDFHFRVDGSGWTDMQLLGQKRDNTFPVTFNAIKDRKCQRTQIDYLGFPNAAGFTLLMTL